jgi:hypothetical protein
MYNDRTVTVLTWNGYPHAFQARHLYAAQWPLPYPHLTPYNFAIFFPLRCGFSWNDEFGGEIMETLNSWHHCGRSLCQVNVFAFSMHASAHLGKAFLLSSGDMIFTPGTTSTCGDPVTRKMCSVMAHADTDFFQWIPRDTAAKFRRDVSAWRLNKSPAASVCPLARCNSYQNPLDRPLHGEVAT